MGDCFRCSNHSILQLTDPRFQPLSFEERFSILVDAEWSARKSNRLTKLIKKAGYSASGASVEDIPLRKMGKAQILRLASCSYIPHAQNVVILGSTGTGKTYLACAPFPSATMHHSARKHCTTLRGQTALLGRNMHRAFNMSPYTIRYYTGVLWHIMTAGTSCCLF